MKKLVFKVLAVAFIVVALSVTSFSSYTFAKDDNAYLIVFKDNQIPNEAKNILHKKYPNLETTSMSEIGTIKLEKTNGDMQNQAIKELRKSLQDKIEYIGRENKLHLPKNVISKKENISKTSFNSSNKRTSIFKNSLKNDIQDGELSKILGWDTDEITEQGKSYAKQSGNHDIKIALVDSGIDFNHPDLENNILSKGRSFVPNVDNTEDHMGHGTMTAGSIAANGKMLGVGPHLGIIPYKVMDNWVDGAESAWVIQAIIAAANDNVDIINLSLGTYKSLNKEEDSAIVEGYSRALKYAHKKGSIVVASAGNDGYDTSNPSNLAKQMGLEGDKQIHLPGSASNYLINVSATNKNDKLSSYSNYGGITLAAPGGDYGEEWEANGIDPSELVLVTYPTSLPQPYISQVLNLPEGYTLSAGTSLAAPKVAGAIGVLLAESKEKGYRELSTNKIEKILRKSSVDLGARGKDPQFGYGRLNLNKALDLVK
ncbi:S8 family serine peptidase [Priestia megaterium]|uniref:S8 family serine peptidase n=1 Tax=Priestia megaterium TaxID=1404 RepID=UPI00285AF5E3|nr:S8 family serine peptidase [Priestia megaterium]MDR7246986.1 subtilisin family serine protease [Priestia megaterium]